MPMNNSSHDWDTKYHDTTAKVYVLEKERKKKRKEKNH
jgi:hypothetical protein